MRRRRWLAAVLCAAVAFGATAVEAARKNRGDGADAATEAAPPTPPEPGVDVRIAGGVRQTTIVYPGRLIGYAVPRTTGGGRRIVALIDPDNPMPELEPEQDADAPPAPKEFPSCPRDEAERTAPRRNLYELREDGLVLLRTAIPADVSGVESLDVDGDGLDELLLVRDGRRDVLGASVAEDRVLLDDPDLPSRSRGHAAGSGRYVVTRGNGVLRVHRPGDDGAWSAADEVDLPTRARMRTGGFQVWTNPVHRAGHASDGTRFWVSTLNDAGVRRVGSRVVAVAPDGTTASHDSWGRLPEPEEVMESFPRMLDDAPVLIVTTRPANKLNLFGEKRVRLFGLAVDRSRLGIAPRFAVESRINLWQSAEPFILDVDHDGHEDLVLGYWKGMKDDRVVLDVYRRNAAGGFEMSPRTTGFDVEDASRSFVGYGHDLDGDGRSDLVLRASGRIVMYPGRASRNGKKLVNVDSPVVLLDTLDARGDEWVEIGVGPGGGTRYSSRSGTRRPVFVDLDGDGRDEVVTHDPGGRGWPGILRFASVGSAR